MFGVQDSALPLIRGDLGLSYAAIGLLLSAPAFAANLIEMPIGLLADGPRRNLLVIAGGLAFTGSLLMVAVAPGFAILLLALAILYPASGAFVYLSQADLMDAVPGRREQNMARWTLAGSLGALAGPGLLTVALWLGAGWRGAYAAMAVIALAVLVSRALSRPPAHHHPDGGPTLRAAVAAALKALRRGEVVRSLLLLESSDLMLDVLTGFLALYFVDVLGQPPWYGAVVVAVRVASNLAGDLISVQVLERVPGVPYVRATAIASAVAFAGVLIVPGVIPKLALIAVLSVLTAGWYPVLQAMLYRALPEQSGASMAIGNVFRLATTPVALIIGVVASKVGLSAALWMLIVSPLLLVLWLRKRDQLTA